MVDTISSTKTSIIYIFQCVRTRTVCLGAWLEKEGRKIFYLRGGHRKFSDSIGGAVKYFYGTFMVLL